MNRLWVRLTLAFGLVTLVGLITVAILAARQVNTQFRHLVARNQMMDSALLDDLAHYYATSGNWTGVEGVLNLHPPAGGMGPGQGMMRRGMPGLVLADASGNVVYGQAKGSADRLNRQERARAVPIESQQQTVGYLVVRAPEQVPLTTPDRDFLAQITRSLIQAGLIAGGLGLVLGLATLTRTITTYYLAFMVIFWLLQRCRVTRTIRLTLVALAGFAVIIVPWMVRNQHAVGKAVICTLTGINLYIGNQPASGPLRGRPRRPDEVRHRVRLRDSLGRGRRLSHLLPARRLGRRSQRHQAR